VSRLLDPAPPTPRRLARGAAALAIAAGFLTACGGDSGDGAAASPPASESADGGAAESITATEADFTISLDDDSLSPGTYEITVDNEGKATHDLVVEKDGADVAGTDKIQPGESATLTVDLESGDYVFYCSIGTHRSMGMEIDVSVS
jgi:plastocyanin